MAPLSETPPVRLFRESHAQRYGLAVIGRDEVTGAATCAVCLFCRHFGREERPGKKRKAPTTVKLYRNAFRTDLYLQHVLLQHPARWEQYKRCADEDKRAFFPADPAARSELEEEQVVSTAEAAAAAKRSPAEKHCWFLLPKRLVELVLPPVAAWVDRPWQPTSVFRVCEVAEQSVEGERGQFYHVALVRRADLEVAVDALAAGLSPRQAARHLAALERRATAGGVTTSLPVLKETDMRDLARLAVAESLRVAGRLLAEAWGFGLVLREVTAAPTLPGAGYLDVRVVVYAQGELRDIHVVALPMFERRTAGELAQVVETVLDAVFPLWRAKVLGISHDGHPLARGRTDAALADGRAPFAVPLTSLSKHRTAEVFSLVKTSILNSTPTNPSRVLHETWGACRQVSLALSEFYESLLGGSFLPVLRTVIAYVRGDPVLLQEMGQPPTVSSVTNLGNIEGGAHSNNKSVDLHEHADWLVMGVVTQWITDKRVRLRKQLAGLSNSATSSSATATTVDDVWWVAFFVVHWIATRANDAFLELRLPRVSRTRQGQVITEMAVELFAIFNIQKGEQTEDQEQRYFSPDGKLSILKSSVNDFLGDQGIFVINVADGLEAAASDKVLENIGVCMLNLAESLTDLSTTSLEEGGAAGLATEDVDLPPVLPQDLARLSGRDFTALLKQHKGLMHVSFSEEELNNLDREYQAFHRAATRDAEMKKALAQCHKESPFVQTWALTKGRYPLLQAFAGGLASSYAARDFDCKKSPVDVSLGGDVTEDADVLRLAATDFGLETKLHARQLDALGRLSDTDCASG